MLPSTICVFPNILIKLTSRYFTVYPKDSLHVPLSLPTYSPFKQITAHFCNLKFGIFAVAGQDQQDKNMLYIYKIKYFRDSMKQLFRAVELPERNVTLFLMSQNLIVSWIENGTSGSQLKLMSINLLTFGFMIKSIKKYSNDSLIKLSLGRRIDEKSDVNNMTGLLYINVSIDSNIGIT